MLGKRLINTTVAGESCTTDTLDLAGMPAGSCVAYYKLDSTAADVTGNYDGTATDVTYTNSGQFSQAAVFNGSTSQIQIAQNILSSNATASFSCWAKGASFANTGAPDIIFQNTLGGFYFALLTSSSNFEVYIRNSSGTNITAIQYPLSNFNTVDWYNIVVTFSGLNSAINLYVNNSLVATATAPSSIISYALNNSIGGETGTSTLGWNGSIDQIRIYNQALSQANVDTLFNEVQCPCTTDTVDYPTTNLAYYQLDGNPQDSTTNGYDGVASNVTYNTGKFGQAGVFNGSNSEIQINGLSTFLGSSSSKSWSCWVKTTATSGGNRAIISDYNTGVGNYNFDCFMIPGDGKVYLVSNAGGTGGNIISSATINNGEWHHICAVQNTTTNTLELYIDSNSQGTISIGTGTRTSPLFIGTYGVGYYWDGSIDQVRIFNTALTPDQVTDLYDEVYCVPPPLDFETTLYTGTGNNQTIYNSGFQPDLVWVKSRTEPTNHTLFDTIRGSGQYLRTDLTDGNVSVWSPYGVHFDVTDGFVVKDDANGGYYVNKPSATYVAWQWKAGGNTSTFNIDDVGYATASAAGLDSGTITPTAASINTEKGFSIIQYTGNSTNNATLAHGLSQPPQLWIGKQTTLTNPWMVLSSELAEGEFMYLNTTDSKLSSPNVSFDPTSTTVKFQGGQLLNSSTPIIGYAWHSVAGHSKIGSYLGNGGSQVISTDFQARFILIKTTTSAGLHWYMLDSDRDGSTTNINQILEANLPNTEVTSGSINVNFNTSNITINSSSVAVNAAGQTYIYMAFA